MSDAGCTSRSDHASRVLAAMYKLYECQLLCDTTLLVENVVTFSVHAVVLAASSEYFKTRLCSTDEKHASLPYVSSSAMTSLLDFMYTGSLNIDQSNVWSILGAATQLQMSAVIELCDKFLKEQTVLKSSRETTERSICLAGSDAEMEDWTIPENEDAKESLSPNDGDMNSGDECEERDSMAGILTSSKQQNRRMPQALSMTNSMHDQQATRLQLNIFDRGSGNRKEIEGLAASVNPNGISSESSQHALLWEDPQNIPFLNDIDSMESDNVTNTFAPDLSTTDVHAKLCNQALRKPVLSSTQKCALPKKKFICKFCLKPFRYYSAMKSHIRLNHIFPHRSELCRRFSKNVVPEPAQMLLPDGAVRHVCLGCDAKFALNSLYLAHFSKIHCVSLKCNSCGKLFASPKLLSIHKACSHKIGAAVPRMLCNHCHRPFIHRRAFETHTCRDAVRKPSKTARKPGKNVRKPSKTVRKPGKPVRKPSKTVRKPKKPILKPTKRHSDAQTSSICPYCSREFRYRKSFVNHVAGHKKQTSGKSLLEVLGSEYELDAAVIVEKGWKCEEGCELVLPSHALLRKHMKQKHPLVVYECGRCLYSTQVKIMMANHTKLKHSNDREKMCNICGKQFSKVKNCKIHKYKKHKVDDPTLKVYHCEVPGCTYSACQVHSMKAHEIKHIDEKPFMCSVCGKRLKTQVNLDNHVNRIHLLIRPFICEKCGLGYGCAGELDVHMARHGEEKRHKCNQCDYASHVKADYQSHMFAIHKITVVGTFIHHCSVCDYATDRRGRMRDHEICHLGIRDFCCSQCDKRFMTRATLLEHVRCVHTAKTLACAQCSYVSSTRRHLVEHTQVMHTYRDMRPYHCSYCDYRSSISGNCRKHCKVKHQGMPVKWVKVCDTSPNRMACSPAARRVFIAPQQGIAALTKVTVYDAPNVAIEDTKVQVVAIEDVLTDVSSTVYLPQALRRTFDSSWLK